MKEADCEAIKQCGLRQTRGRSAILEILEHSPQPVSAEQVFLELKKKQATVNMSTVYRTLEALAAKGLAIKLNLSGENRALYELNRMAHRHYLICLGCKKITAINSCPLQDYEQILARKTQYAISGHKLDVYGYCPECQKKSESENS